MRGVSYNWEALSNVVFDQTIALLDGYSDNSHASPLSGSKPVFATNQLSLKFLLEAVIAFRHSKHFSSQKILSRLAALIMSDQSRRLLARNPYNASYFLSTYVFFPRAYKSAEWSRLLLTLTKTFPSNPSASPLFRLEEVKLARWMLTGGLRRKPDVSLFFNRSPWLDDEQMYAFTHQFFYLTDYGHSPLKKPSDECRSFIEDCFMLNLQRDNLDLMLEFLICYSACANRNPAVLQLFEFLTWRLFSRKPEMHVMPTPDDHHVFAKYYHQYFLAILYDSIDQKNTTQPHNTIEIRTEYLSLLRRNRLIVSISALNITKTYLYCARLQGLKVYKYYKSILSAQATAIKVTNVTNT